AEGAVRHRDARQPAGRLRRRVRLHEDPAGRHRSLAPAADAPPRHRRLRALREPRLAARLLRGRRQVHRLRDADGAPQGEEDRRQDRAAGDEGPRHQRRQEEPGRFVAPMPTEFKIPNLGDGIKGGDVLNVLVKVGDTVAKDQGVLELETDKATIEVPSPAAGTVAEIKVKSGDKVTVGQVVLTFNEGAAAAAAPSGAPSPSPEKAPPAAAPPQAS